MWQKGLKKSRGVVTVIFINYWLSSFCLVYFSKNSKVQKRGKVNLIGRLQLSTEKAKQEENDGIVALRILRIQVRENSSSYASSLS